jgi:hypothetical protein
MAERSITEDHVNEALSSQDKEPDGTGGTQHHSDEVTVVTNSDKDDGDEIVSTAWWRW